MEKITDPDYQNTVELCQAHKYNTRVYYASEIEGTKIGERTRRTKTKDNNGTKEYTWISQIIEEKKSEEVSTI